MKYTIYNGISTIREAATMKEIIKEAYRILRSSCGNSMKYNRIEFEIYREGDYCATMTKFPYIGIILAYHGVAECLKGVE